MICHVARQSPRVTREERSVLCRGRQNTALLQAIEPVIVDPSLDLHEVLHTTVKPFLRLATIIAQTTQLRRSRSFRDIPLLDPGARCGSERVQRVLPKRQHLKVKAVSPSTPLASRCSRTLHDSSNRTPQSGTSRIRQADTSTSQPRTWVSLSRSSLTVTARLTPRPVTTLLWSTPVLCTMRMRRTRRESSSTLPSAGATLTPELVLARSSRAGTRVSSAPMAACLSARRLHSSSLATMPTVAAAFPA